MVDVPLGKTAFVRGYASEASLFVDNLFFEQNPTNFVEQTALIARPGSTLLFDTTGPVRGMWAQEGIFNGDLFVVAGVLLQQFDVSEDGSFVTATTTIEGSKACEGCFTKGSDYERLFITTGASLMCYEGKRHAKAVLTCTATGADDNDAATTDFITTEVVSIGGVYYAWATGTGVQLPTSGWKGEHWVRGVNDDGNLTWTHHTGHTSDLWNSSYRPIVGNPIYVSVTMTNRTAGSITVSMGGGQVVLEASGELSVDSCTNTAGLSIDPSSSFNGTLSFAVSAAAANDSNVDTKYLDANTVEHAPDGTAAYPWRVAYSSTDTAPLLSALYTAINALGTEGLDYSTGLVRNPVVRALQVWDTDTTLTVRSLSGDTDGSEIAVSVTAGMTLAWDHGTLSGGGVRAIEEITTPDNFVPGHIVSFDSYVLVSVSGGDRVYWLRPGETRFNDLDYATAEKAPDGIVGFSSSGATLFVLGQTTIESWYATGSTDSAGSAFAPIAGRVYEMGAQAGSIANIKGAVLFIGSDGVVYALSNAPERLSNNGVEEQVRRFLLE